MEELDRLVAELALLPFPDARPEQLPPDERPFDRVPDWRLWAIITGRGFGKTRVGAEWTVQQCASRRNLRAGICAQSFDAMRGVCIEGESGLIAVLDRRKIRHKYNRALGKIEFPANGSEIRGFSAEAPNKPRGYQTHVFWMDEWAAWENIDEATSNINLGVRLTHADGLPARRLITTTPRPIFQVRQLLANPKAVIVRGSTLDNRANLDEGFIEEVLSMVDTPLGRQEVFGEVLDDISGLLFNERSIQWWTKAQANDDRFVLGPMTVRFDECEWFAIMDVAASDRTVNDWSVVSVYAWHPSGHLVLVDVVRAKLGEDQHAKMALSIIGRWPLVRSVGIEKSMYSTTVMRDLGRELPKGVALQPLDPNGESKVTRALPAAKLGQEGRLWFPADHPLTKPTKSQDRRSIIDEMLEFPLGKHDDFVDTLGYAAQRVAFRAVRMGGDAAPSGAESMGRIIEYVRKVERERRRRRRSGGFR